MCTGAVIERCIKYDRMAIAIRINMPRQRIGEIVIPSRIIERDAVCPSEQRSYNTLPGSLLTRTDSITFYYSRWDNNLSDTLTWHIYSDSYGHSIILDAPFYYCTGTHKL